MSVNDAFYKQGFIDGLYAHAVHKDGGLVVGVREIPFKKASAEVENYFNYNPREWRD